MKKRNKKYKPKTIVQNPLNYFIGGYKRIQGEELTDLYAKNHMAMVKLCSGQADRDTWDVLVGMINMSLVLAEQHFDDQYHEILLAARDGLHAIGKRYMDYGRFVLKGEEMNALNNAMEVHEAQLEALRIIDIERAYDEIQRRIKHNHNTMNIYVTKKDQPCEAGTQ